MTSLATQTQTNPMRFLLIGLALTLTACGGSEKKSDSPKRSVPTRRPQAKKPPPPRAPDVKGLLKGLVSQDVETRRVSAFELSGVFSDDPTIPAALVQALDDPDPIVRRRAIFSLRNFKAPKDTDKKLIQRLDDSDKMVRIEACFTIGQFGYKNALPRLRELSQSAERDLRDAAASALIQIDPPK